MKTKTTITYPNGDKKQCLLWGNNAAWICQCGELLGDRTSLKEEAKVVSCECGKKYKLFQCPNKNGNFYLGAAKEVRLINS